MLRGCVLEALVGEKRGGWQSEALVASMLPSFLWLSIPLVTCSPAGEWMVDFYFLYRHWVASCLWSCFGRVSGVPNAACVSFPHLCRVLGARLWLSAWHCIVVPIFVAWLFFTHCVVPSVRKFEISVALLY